MRAAWSKPLIVFGVCLVTSAQARAQPWFPHAQSIESTVANGDLSLRLRVKPVRMATKDSVFAVAEIRNNRQGPVTILRPFGDPYFAEGVQIKLWGESGRITYTGPTADYDLDKTAFVTLGAKEIATDTLELTVRHFAGTGKAGHFTLRYDHAYAGTWDKKVAGGGVKGIWHGSICSREIQLKKTDDASPAPKQKPNKELKGPDPDPKLVEAIRQAGGQIHRIDDGHIVVLGFYSEQPRATSRLEFLKKLDRLQELAVNCTASAEWMESISQLPELRTLRTYRCEITDQALGHLKTVKSLRHLDLEVSPVTDEGLKALVGLPRLETLLLRHLPVTDEGLKTVARMPGLKKLSLVALKIAPAGILALRDSPVEELIWWDVDRPHLAYLPYVKKLKNLKRLDLSSNYVADEAAEHLREIKTLETLNLYDHRLSDEGLRKLSDLTNLHELNLSLGFEARRQDYAHPISDRGIEHLTRLKELRVLSLSSTAVTDAGLRQVAKLTQLRQLNLGGTKVSATGLAALGTLKHLETLYLTETAALAEPRIDLRSLKSLKTVYAYESDERKMLVPEGCVIITFD